MLYLSKEEYMAFKTRIEEKLRPAPPPSPEPADKADKTDKPEKADKGEA
jgi:hypothetical protein